MKSVNTFFGGWNVGTCDILICVPCGFNWFNQLLEGTKNCQRSSIKSLTLTLWCWAGIWKAFGIVTSQSSQDDVPIYERLFGIITSHRWGAKTLLWQFFDNYSTSWNQDNHTDLTIKAFGIIIRARWELLFHHIICICMYSYVKLNFKTGFFSSTFWFKRIFISEIGLLVFGLFTF